MSCLLAIDQGTSSSRAVLYDSSVRPLATAQREFEQIYPRPGWVEHDPEAIWQSVLGLLDTMITPVASLVGITSMSVRNTSSGSTISSSVGARARSISASVSVKGVASAALRRSKGP